MQRDLLEDAVLVKATALFTCSCRGTSRSGQRIKHPKQVCDRGSTKAFDICLQLGCGGTLKFDGARCRDCECGCNQGENLEHRFVLKLIIIWRLIMPLS